jgi:hypothetical protein
MDVRHAKRTCELFVDKRLASWDDGCIIADGGISPLSQLVGGLSLMMRLRSTFSFDVVQYDFHENVQRYRSGSFQPCCTLILIQSSSMQPTRSDGADIASFRTMTHTNTTKK